MLIKFEYHGRYLMLDCQPLEIISDIINILKIKLSISRNMRLIYDKKILNNSETLLSYNIREHSIIYILFTDNIIGGEFGGSSKLFTDPTKVMPKDIKISSKGPSYRTVTEGMNLFGICKNKKCLAYDKEVIHMFGYGTFDVINGDKENIICPSCEFPLISIDTCGFWKCKYFYKGTKFENKKLKEVNYSNINNSQDSIDYFNKGNDNENKSLWVELKITADKL